MLRIEVRKDQLEKVQTARRTDELKALKLILVESKSKQ